MPEGHVHRELKAAAGRWLWESGYAAVAEEVIVPSVGVVDVVAAGRWKRRNPRDPNFGPSEAVDRHHVVFVECKASRADFLHDLGRQMHFAFALEERARRGVGSSRRRRWRHASPALGKFDTCLIRPFANFHYVMTTPKLIRTHELPRRWGWVVDDGIHVRVVRKAVWQEVADTSTVEGAIARALTARLMTDSTTGAIGRYGRPAPAVERRAAASHGAAIAAGGCSSGAPIPPEQPSTGARWFDVGFAASGVPSRQEGGGVVTGAGS